jgi:hypothetical protein
LNGHAETCSTTSSIALTLFLGAQELWTLRAGYQAQLVRSDFSEHYMYGRLGRLY